MKTFLILVALLLAGATGSPAGAQSRSAQTPVRLGVTLPLSKPALSGRGLLLQAGMGILGGAAGGLAAALPVMMASWDRPVAEGVAIVLVGGGFVAGSTYGIHRAGRAQGMGASPWATTAGVVAGLTVAGALMQPFIDEEGYAEGPAPLLVFVMPSAGGTAGYALTRRDRTVR
jgi:hypothetical protein